MGRISKGILGGFSGTVGTVVGGNWRGIDYMRSQPKRRNFSSSRKQLEQQLRFGLMTKFQQPVNSLLNVSFKSYAIRMTGANSALSYNIRNAVKGSFPDYEIDYSLFLMSRGDLPNAQNPTATAAAGSQVNFAWTSNVGTGKASGTDKAILVVYCPEMRSCMYTTSGAERSAGSDSLNVSSYSGKTVETWIGFFSENEREVATSIYTGSIVIT
jgi:hypothetical protein